MKRKHSTPTTPGAVSGETHNDRSNGNSEAKAEEVLSESSSEEAATYDLWGTNCGEETNAASNSFKKWSSETQKDDDKNYDGELSWEDDSDDVDSVADGNSDSSVNETSERLVDNVSSVIERLDYMITKERDPGMKESMLKYKDLLKFKPDVEMEVMKEGEHELDNTEKRGLCRTKEHKCNTQEHELSDTKELELSDTEKHELSNAEKDELSKQEHQLNHTKVSKLKPKEEWMKFFLPRSAEDDEDDEESYTEEHELSKQEHQLNHTKVSKLQPKEDWMNFFLPRSAEDDEESYTEEHEQRNTEEHELSDAEKHELSNAEKDELSNAEKHELSHTEEHELSGTKENQLIPTQVSNVSDIEDEVDDYFEIREKLFNIKPLPQEFFYTNNECHPVNVARELGEIDKLISKETDEDLKLRMQKQRKIILDRLNEQLKGVGPLNQNREKLSFNESVSKRMSTIINTVKKLEEKKEEEYNDENNVVRKVFESCESKVEEDCQLSQVIAETVEKTEEEKKRNATEITSLESHKFVKALPCTILAPPKDSDDEDNIEEDEYKDDTSDEEDIRNTVGNIPMRWYDDYDHVGYDWEGNKIVKPPAGDELDNFLRKMEDPNFWRTVKDPQTGQDVVLCNEDVEVLNRLKNSKIPDATHDEYGPWIEWFSSEVMQTPVCDFPESKTSFIPSRHEAKKVSKIVYAIKRGWIKPKKKKPKKKAIYMLWESDNTAEPMRRIHNHISAPKRSLPNHAESYNPPSEYLFDKKELKEWKSFRPSQKKLPFIPRKYSSLREVPAYENYIEERFRRCLDLYLCPRTRKMKLLIEPDDLLPKLPSPRDLQPFPTTQSLVYKGHTEMVRTISVEPKGQYLASGSDDFTVKLWEVATGRCVRTIPVGGIVRSVSWCPNEALALLAIAADSKLLLINPCVGDILVVKKTDVLLQEEPEQDVLVSDRLKNAIQWEQATGDDWKKGIRVIINHFKEIKQVTWHGRGDYFASVMPDAQNRSVIIHQVSKRRSQIPFSRSKGLVQCVLFHPIRPVFFVATQKFVRIYDLVKQIVLKKLFSNAKWISTMAIHPAGDNLLVGTYDRKVLWFDLDLSTKPYQTLRLHSGGVRGVAYHRNYPLFATSSDDNNVVVSHGMVYNDLLQNALIVPLKRLSFHEKRNDFSVFDVVFHPTQPWLFSTGADSTVRLYT